jgi:hypothetical protein
MTDFDRLLRRLDDLPSRNVWPRVGTPDFGVARGSSMRPARRLTAGITAVAVGLGAIALAYAALRENSTGSSRVEPGKFVIAAAFPGAGPQLFVVPEDRKPVPLAEDDLTSSPAVSPDGRLVAYERALDRGRSALTVLYLDGSSTPRDLLEVDGIGLAPAWSPDGDGIAILNQGEIWLVPIDGGRPRALDVGEAHPRSVAWSPDGEMIAFTDSSRSTMVGDCLADGSTGIWLIETSGSRAQHLTHNGCWSVAWSARGSSLVAMGTGFLPVLVDPDSGSTRQIKGTPPSVGGGVPALSTDGKLVGFAAGLQGLWIYRIDDDRWQLIKVDGGLDVQGLSFMPPGAPTPHAMQEELCDFPDVRPTYLPWLAPGRPIPAPAMEQSVDGGGPQRLDPGYSILHWGHGDVTKPDPGRDVGSVSIWRATQSVLSFPEDPAVPNLPDGSTGRLSVSQGDWAIIWGDPAPGGVDDDCSGTTLVAYFPNLSRAEARREILAIARSLVPVSEVE